MTGLGNNRLPALVAEIVRAHAECRRATMDAIRHAVAAGHPLNEARQLVPHGKWVPWLRANVPGVSVRTAQRYMAAAKRAGKNDTVSFFRLRDLARPTRERFGLLGNGRALILTPSAHAGFTFVTLVNIHSGDAEGLLKPMRDDAIPRAMESFFGIPWPTNWTSRRSVEHRVNPWLVDAKPTADAATVEQIKKLISAANERLDEFGYTGQRSLFPQEQP